MTHLRDLSEYTPGDYGKKRIKPSEWINAQIHKWSIDKERKTIKTEPVMPPTVCISRKIGVGALEIADLLAEKIGYKVADRQVIEHMASELDLSEKALAVFDERYPGMMQELSNLLFAEKSFIESDYGRQLTKSVLALANLEPTIFVGRGTHLVLPREKVMAVRLIGSNEFRINRLAKVMKTSEEDAEKMMTLVDKEQRNFFKTMYHKKDAVPYEFDLVINRDYVNDAHKAANIIAYAFREKFGTDLS
jgi:cytidylate kinase